jgi:subtilisin family serine protease
MDKLCKLLVKFKAAAITRVENGKLWFTETGQTAATMAFVTALQYHHVLPALAATGSVQNQVNSIDFSRYRGLVYLDNIGHMAPAELDALLHRLNELDVVEYAVLESVLIRTAPLKRDEHQGESAATPPVSESVRVTTGNLIPYQGYLRGGQGIPNSGIDAEYAWSVNARGQGIRCVCIDGNFLFDHEDLQGDNFIDLAGGTPNAYEPHHGTASVGILFARNNGIGMQGIGHALERCYGISPVHFGLTGAFLEAFRHLRAGDVVTASLEARGPGPRDWMSPDFLPAIWEAVNDATAAGINVILLAGNEALDLDTPPFDEYRARPDNHCIRVGAGISANRIRTWFSNFGSPIHLQAWGNRSVATTGYGDLFNQGLNRTYTKAYFGTSSATPIVAGAVVLLQSWFKAIYGTHLLPLDARNLLIKTGTPQAQSSLQQHIGPLPDLRRALESLNTFKRISTVEELAELLDDHHGETLTALLQSGWGVHIEPHRAVPLGRIVFPSGEIAHGRVISINNTTPVNIELVMNNQTIIARQGHKARYVMVGLQWQTALMSISQSSNAELAAMLHEED